MLHKLPNNNLISSGLILLAPTVYFPYGLVNLGKSGKTFKSFHLQGIDLNTSIKMLSEPEHLDDEYQCER